ncbi:two-component system, OmpR family, catabolic regulation response regulator CreB [Formivibrio citricus]|uniref:Two-component system, OmpR family, catabolic regulation response regulator CreB n=1 Tax=Formivibrio citricus TaxID=83765 RepID=A0A1I5BLR2_9NEIS|nr:two-component system response regulator CreB [Formivibrio citricus]SFN75734.1 two-component system, OmpR family, catabolic regulation response regulator CreB [Formivibrio citricus]
MSLLGAVLVVEDEAAIADTLLYSLKAEGFATEWVTLGRDALARLAQGGIDCILLDVGLPDMRGFDVCRELRKTSDVPVLFLTARSDEIDRIVGLEIGADDYVTKPFSPREVAARIKTILRRAARQITSAPESAALALDRAGGRITCHGQPLTLTRYEFLLLAELIEHPERIFSRAQLMDRIWQDALDTDERTVDTHIKTLRTKLRAAVPDFDPIITHRGLGYSLSRIPPCA